MRKVLYIGLACVAAATLTNAVMADDLTLFFDVRDNAAAIDTPVPPYTNTLSVDQVLGNSPDYVLENAGGRGDHGIVYVSPTLEDHDGDLNPEHLDPVTFHDASVATFYLYGDLTAQVGEILSSLGIDIDIAAAAVGDYAVADMSTIIGETIAELGGTPALVNDPWDGVAYSTPSSASGVGIKAVRVPVTDPGGGPVFDATLGIGPGTGYRLASFTVTGAGPEPTWVVYTPDLVEDHELDAFISVNNLLITRVADPGPALALPLNLGYLAGAPEAATADGDTLGATSATQDASIQVQPKGDFDRDGAVTFNDLSGFFGALFAVNTDINRAEAWIGDFDGLAGDFVTFGDLGGMFANVFY